MPIEVSHIDQCKKRCDTEFDVVAVLFFSCFFFFLYCF